MLKKYIVEMDSSLISVLKNSGAVRIIEETEDDKVSKPKTVLGDYKRKSVQGLYNYDHFEHPDGSFIQSRHGPEKSYLHQDAEGNRTKFTDFQKLKNHVINYHKSKDLNESFNLNSENSEKVFDIFQKSYQQETGSSWSKEKFLSRARAWTFYGDENSGFIAIRAQRSGPKKLVGVAGDPKSILKGLTELQSEGGPIWGAVSEPLARMAKKRGMIVPSFFPGGGLLIRTLISTIPPEVFGGDMPEVNKDGSLTFDYPDVGRSTKYLIGNKAYFLYALKMPQIAEKIKAIPGVNTLLKLMGIL